MPYYQEKMRACKYIDEQFESGKSDDEILLSVERMFGFGEKMVKARIALLTRTAKK